MSIAIDLVYGIWVVPDVVLLGGVSTMLSETRTLHYTPKHAILPILFEDWTAVLKTRATNTIPYPESG